ncbi:MAG: hypothetical protein M1829_001111 [Trizodia sp. TS-e1964]|nr:MAG: hypothetical protein M1829_001111 [Trizodia sp. TS-e1964]
MAFPHQYDSIDYNSMPAFRPGPAAYANLNANNSQQDNGIFADFYSPRRSGFEEDFATPGGTPAPSSGPIRLPFGKGLGITGSVEKYSRVLCDPAVARTLTLSIPFEQTVFYISPEGEVLRIRRRTLHQPAKIVVDIVPRYGIQIVGTPPPCPERPPTVHLLPPTEPNDPRDRILETPCGMLNILHGFQDMPRDPAAPTQGAIPAADRLVGGGESALTSSPATLVSVLLQTTFQVAGFNAEEKQSNCPSPAGYPVLVPPQAPAGVKRKRKRTVEAGKDQARRHDQIGREGEETTTSPETLAESAAATDALGSIGTLAFLPL